MGKTFHALFYKYSIIYELPSDPQMLSFSNIELIAKKELLHFSKDNFSKLKPLLSQKLKITR